MKLDIRKLDLPWCDVFAGHAEARVRLGLERLGGRVGSVFVQLANSAGLGDGPDPRGQKHCRVAVRLTTGHEVMVDGLDPCAFRAVDGAVDQLVTALRDRLLRERARRQIGSSARRRAGA